MSAFKNVIVVGASGNVGVPVVAELLSLGFNVSALTRESSNSTFPEGVRVVKTDYSEGSLEAALTGQDAVVCTMGFPALNQQIAVAKAAENVGVKRFIPAEFGNLRNKKSIDMFERLLEHKANTLEYLKQRGEANKEFTWTALATGAFFDWQFTLERTQGRPGVLGLSLKNRTAEIYDTGDAPIEATTLEVAARAVGQILSKPDETANKFLVVRNLATSQNEVLAVLEELTGEKWKVTKISTQAVLQRGIEGLQKGNQSSFLDVLAADYMTERRGVLKEDGIFDNELLGVEPADLKAVLKTVLAAES